MSSLAARRRASSNAPSQSRKDRLALNSNQFTHIDTSDEEDVGEEERLRLDEEEQERLLTEANGEAAESSTSTSSSSKKQGQTDQEIADEYGSTAKKRKPRVTLQPTHLTGADGLIRIRSDIGGSMKLNTHKKRSLDAAASYSRDLVKRYKSWSYNMFPSLAFEDVLSRVETFGSKREIKSYLQEMRQDVRNAHLEKVFGKESAERMIAELEDGLKQQQVEDEMQLEYDADQLPPASSATNTTTTSTTNTTQTSTSAVLPPITTRATSSVSSKLPPPTSRVVDSDSEEELEFDKPPSAASAAPASTFFDTDDDDDGDDATVSVKKVDSHEIDAPTKPESPLVDSDDEQETGSPPDVEQKQKDEIAVVAGPAKVLEEIVVAPETFHLQSDAPMCTTDERNETIPKEAPSQTQATVLASSSQMDLAECDLTQATVLATSTQVDASFAEDGVSQTQATVLATSTQVDASFAEDDASQTQATVLATSTQVDTSFAEDGASQTQATVLATSTQVDASFAEDSASQTQATVLATSTQVDTSFAEDSASQTQATVLATSTQLEMTEEDADVNHMVPETQPDGEAAQAQGQDDMTQATVLASQLETQPITQ